MLRLPGGVPEAQTGPRALLLNHGLNDGMIVHSNHLWKREKGEKHKNISREKKIVMDSSVQTLYMSEQIFKGLGSQCATYWQNIICFTGRFAMQMFCLVFQKKRWHPKTNKNVSNLIKPTRFLMMSICRHKAHLRKWLYQVASVFSRMTQCSMALPICSCFYCWGVLIGKND